MGIKHTTKGCLFAGYYCWIQTGEESEGFYADIIGICNQRGELFYKCLLEGGQEFYQPTLGVPVLPLCLTKEKEIPEPIEEKKSQGGVLRLLKKGEVWRRDQDVNLAAD